MSEANATLKEAFRHHAWATRELIDFCSELPSDLLSQAQSIPLAEDHGSILETLDHIVCADGRYVGALTGHSPLWAHERGLSSDLRELARAAEDAEALWMEFLSLPDDPMKEVFLDAGTYQTHAAIVTAQALHHGSAHREQICAIIRNVRLEPPELQPWDFADATARSRWVKPA